MDVIRGPLATPLRRRETSGACRQLLCLPAPLMLFPSFFEPSGQQEGVTKVGVSVGKVRPEAQGRSVVRLRLRRTAETAQSIAEVVVRVGEVRPEAQGRAVAGLRLRGTAETAQGVAGVAMRLRVVRLDGDGLAIGGDGLVEPAERREGVAEVVVRVRVIWPDGDGLGNQPNRLQGAALLVAQDTEK